MDIKEEEFLRVKNKAEKAYKEVSEIHCPYFSEKVAFNSSGLEHLKFKKHRKARPKKDQYMRFKLLHLAPIVIRSSKTLQGIKEGKSIERTRVNSRTEKALKDVTYYEFIAIIKNKRVKVIVKQVESGQKFLWSIIPFWGKNENKKVLHSGNPEED